MRLTQKQLDRVIANGGRIVSEIGGGKAILSKGNSVSVPIAAATPEPLPLATGPATFTFPGLRLRSWNRMNGSGKKGEQALARQEARIAVESATGLLRFVGSAAILVVQVHPGDTRRWDLFNLCDKYLIDRLVERGVFHDDNREVLRPVAYDHRVGDLAVEIHVTPRRTE